MDLRECEGKQLLARYGIAVPRGAIARTPDDAAAIQRDLGTRVVLKAQVLAGGRGKAGLVQVAEPSEVQRVAETLLGARHRGERIGAILVEEALSPRAECYACVVLDTSSRTRKLFVSIEGGVDVEAHRDAVRSIAFTRKSRPPADELQKTWRGLGCAVGSETALATFTEKLVECFIETGARQVEVNPAGLDARRVIAMDSKVVVEDNAELPIERLDAGDAGLEDEGRSLGLPMVLLGGKIGVITSGAGLGLATVDTISACGSSAANFLDLGGGASAERMKTAIDLVRRVPGVQAIFVNVHGGLNDCMLLAEGVLASGAAEIMPVLVRMSGYRAPEARALLQSRGVRHAGVDPMDECVASLAAALAPAAVSA